MLVCPSRQGNGGSSGQISMSSNYLLVWVVILETTSTSCIDDIGFIRVILSRNLCAAESITGSDYL